MLDLGQNFAGVPRLKITGEPGQKITLRFAERLNPDGTIYTTNLRSARCIDTYICDGKGEETWSPRFTFHGFQYVEITGLKSPPTADTVTGIALSSDTPVVGRFECSDPMLNQLHSNIYWTQRANFIDIPTDCPQRDERLGWTGDAQVYIRTATLNCDVQAFFTKWLVDLTDGQRPDGQFPMVAPVKVAGDDGGPAWADAGVICPWTIYQVYGDRRLARAAVSLDGQVRRVLPQAEHARAAAAGEVPLLRRLAEHRRRHAQGRHLHRLLRPQHQAHGARPPRSSARPRTPPVSTTSTRRSRPPSTRPTSAATAGSRATPRPSTCWPWRSTWSTARRRSRPHATSSRTSRSSGGHLSTGFIGTKDLMLVLSKIGRHDVAYRLLFNDTFPSWGFSIKHGATSIWERWDGWTPEKGFQDPGMNSFAHYSFGAVYQWMVENIGGIKSDGPAYKQILIEPHPGGRLTQPRRRTRASAARSPPPGPRRAGRFP